MSRVSGTDSAATMTAYRLTSSPVVASEVPKVAPMAGNSPMGSTSVVTARQDANARASSAGSRERRPATAEPPTAVTDVNILSV
ncbi:Uncharacterised protein [Mycolicibacterium tokaiense]|uniref:Uncharacterized protein n=1 Tax=Mycolicibacterium tokaiense TaxID=39695 RepID=A0A378THT6_9MYCO|nr:Uncharacterised protein [Mycolicibacterium tokaiense]